MSFRSGTGRAVTVSTESINTARQLLVEQRSEEELDAYARMSLIYDWNIRQETVEGAPVLMWTPPTVSEE